MLGAGDKIIAVFVFFFCHRAPNLAASLRLRLSFIVMKPMFMTKGMSPAVPTALDAAPPPLASLDRAFEVFRKCWRRAAFAQLALALVSLASTACFTALLSLAGAAAVIHFTRSGGGWPQRMAASVSAHAWHTKGRVIPTGTIAALRTLSWFTLVAILADLGTAITSTLFGWMYSFLVPFESTWNWVRYTCAQAPGTSGCTFTGLPGGETSYIYASYDSTKDVCLLSGQMDLPSSWNQNPPTTTLQALFVLSAIAYPILAIHLFVSFLSARAWLCDACDWLELLPRPAAPVAIQWDLAPADGSAKWAAQPLMESSLAVELASNAQ